MKVEHIAVAALVAAARMPQRRAEPVLKIHAALDSLLRSNFPDEALANALTRVAAQPYDESAVRWLGNELDQTGAEVDTEVCAAALALLLELERHGALDPALIAWIGRTRIKVGAAAGWRPPALPTVEIPFRERGDDGMDEAPPKTARAPSSVFEPKDRGEPLSPAEPARAIVVTGHDGTGALVTAFAPETRYALRFAVDAPTLANLARGATAIDAVPEGGLEARWIVWSDNVELLGVHQEGDAQGRERDSVAKLGKTWIAEFDLPIPQHGPSGEVTVDVRTTATAGRLILRLFVGGDEYRKLDVELPFDEASRIRDDILVMAPSHLNPRTWTVPEHLAICVEGDAATIQTIWGENDYGKAEWYGTASILSNPIVLVRRSLDAFRDLAGEHLDNLDHCDMWIQVESGGWCPPEGPGNPARPQEGHAAAMAQLASSPQMRALASDGYALYNACFPDGTELRGVIDGLAPGSRIDFVWTRDGDPAWVSHVPWALMYLDPPDPEGPVDCERFLGLRLRIGSKSWEPGVPSRALGDPGQLTMLDLLYWGGEEGESAAREAAWQRQKFGGWPRQHILPDPDAADPKRQVIKALKEPTPAPVGIIYLFCHCNLSDAPAPVLQFGASGAEEQCLTESDIYQGALPSAPLVFANACMTLHGEPCATSELERRFFARHVRAFLGTESRVPVVLASRFAWLFFRFFLGGVAGSPCSAGEALTFARQFLWRRYRNPGGLFYSLVNQYDLFLASESRVRAMCRGN